MRSSPTTYSFIDKIFAQFIARSPATLLKSSFVSTFIIARWGGDVVDRISRNFLRVININESDSADVTVLYAGARG